MTSQLPPAFVQAIGHIGHTFSWGDPQRPEVVYETRNYGRTHLQKSGQEQRHSGPSASLEASIRRVEASLWLLQTLFCSPSTWWRTLVEQPGATVVPLFFHRGRFLIGPAFETAGAVCPTCAGLRLAQAFPHPGVFLSLLSGPVAVDGSLEALRELFSQPSLDQFVASHIHLLRTGRLASFSLADDCAQVQWHRILPPPGGHPFHLVEAAVGRLFGIPARDWPSSSIAGTGDDSRFLVDPLVGPLVSTTRVLPETNEPEALVGYVTVTGHLGKYTRWHPDVSGSGLGFSEELARWASVGEAAERYSGNYIPLERLVNASEDELTQQRRPHVPLGRFRRFTPEQESATTWPLAPLHGESSIPWIAAETLGAPGEPVLLPAEYVYLNLNRVTKQPSRIPVPLAGIAAYHSRDGALAAAMLELVERDATMLWWHGGLHAKQLVELPPELEEQVGHGVPACIRQWFLLLQTDMPAYVAAGCVYDEEYEILVVGFAARPILADALRKSAAEAWQLRRLSLQLLNRESALWQAIDSGRLPMPVRPFRADRHYREEFRRDFADMRQLAYNLQWYLDPTTHPPALARLSGEPCPYREVPVAWDGPDGELVARCVAQLDLVGERVYCADLTTQDMRALGGLTTVRVVCPGLIGNAPTAFVPLAHPRMLRALLESGGQPHLGPMPHA